MAIIVNDVNSVFIDGKSAITVAAAFEANPARSDEIQAALVAWAGQTAATAAAAMAKLQTETSAALAQRNVDHADAVAHIKDATTAILKAEHAKALADAKAASDKALADLTSKNAELVAQLAGASGSFKITLSAIQQKALELAAVKAGVSPAELVLQMANSTAGSLAKNHTSELLSNAMEKYPSLSEAKRNELLIGIGLPELVGQPIEGQAKYLVKMVPELFEAKSASEQNELLAKLFA